MEFIKRNEWLYRALRTAYQTALPCLATMWATYAATEELTVAMLWFGVGVPMVSGFIAGLMNLKPNG